MAVDAAFAFRASATIAALANNDVMPTLPIKSRLVNSFVPTINTPKTLTRFQNDFTLRGLLDGRSAVEQREILSREP